MKPDWKAAEEADARVASATECTGLVPALPVDADGADAEAALCDVTPPAVRRETGGECHTRR